MPHVGSSVGRPICPTHYAFALVVAKCKATLTATSIARSVRAVTLKDRRRKDVFDPAGCDAETAAPG